MKKKQKNLKVKALFNASVILAGINSPKGGSSVVLKWVKQNKVKGLISEIVLDEVLRHAGKFDLSKEDALKICQSTFKVIIPAPKELSVIKFKKQVIDPGDAHLLASCKEMGLKYLITLDKKHLLVLKGKIKGLTIMTPGELIKKLKKN